MGCIDLVLSRVLETPRGGQGESDSLLVLAKASRIIRSIILRWHSSVIVKVWPLSLSFASFHNHLSCCVGVAGCGGLFCP